jgi:CheY-like chemotaxis protein
MNWPQQDADDQTDMGGRQNSAAVREREQKESKRGARRSFTLDKELYTSGQAARLLDIPARTLRRYLSIGKIEGVQNPITQTWQISVEALAHFIENQGGEAVISPKELVALVIDGKPQVAELLRRFAKQQLSGLTVKEFQEVGDALIESGVRTPDLIIIDITTPFYDGIGLLKLLRSNAHTSASKVLAITDETAGTETLDALGATSMLVKPFSFDDLVQIMGHIFPNGESQELPS